MADPAGCLFPQNAPKTAYGKGCRCERCLDAERDRSRRRYAANLEAERERGRGRYAADGEAARARRHRRYEANRNAVLEYSRRYRAKTREAQRERGRLRRARLSAIAVTARGAYLPGEDEVIRNWEGTDLGLALTLGRSYGSVVSRKRTLRRQESID